MHASEPSVRDSAKGNNGSAFGTRFPIFLRVSCMKAAPKGIQVQEMEIPDWVVYPDKDWVRMTPEAAGLDAARLNRTFANVRKRSHFGYVRPPDDDQWGAVLTRAGYLIYTFG